MASNVELPNIKLSQQTPIYCTNYKPLSAHLNFNCERGIIGSVFGVQSRKIQPTLYGRHTKTLQGSGVSNTLAFSPILTSHNGDNVGHIWQMPLDFQATKS